MKIEARHLHMAADIVGETEDHSTLGFAENALEEFVEASNWHDERPDGPLRSLDPLSLAMGVSIGVVTGKQLVEHERDHSGFCEDTDQAYRCTRLAGHEGDHEAIWGDLTLHVW